MAIEGMKREKMSAVSSGGWSRLAIRQLGVVRVAFSLGVRILGKCSTIHSMPALFFFEAEISWHTLISLFRPGSVHCGSGS